MPTWRELSDERGQSPDWLRDAVFGELRARQENTHCFDCGTSAMWVGASHGIFLCLTCSGKHRQFGVHISFVRGIEMDKFSLKDLLSCWLGGNGRAKETMGTSVDYTGRIAEKYKESLAMRVSQEMDKECHFNNQPKIETSKHQFIFSATGPGKTKPSWAK